MSRGAKLGLGLLGAAVVGLGASSALGSRPDDPEAHGPLAPCDGSPNCFHTQVRLDAAPEAVREVAAEVVRAEAHWFTGRARDLTRTDAGLRAVFKTGPFDDDLDIAVEPDGSGSMMTVRSASRVGESDLGVNRMRAERVVAAIRTRLGA
ncbi:MAG: DUF1499 domain-containing protein [Bacteroidota bacterium]